MSHSSLRDRAAPLRVIVDGTAITAEPSGARTRLLRLYGAAAQRAGLDVTVLTAPDAGVDDPLADSGCRVRAARRARPSQRLFGTLHPAGQAAGGGEYDLIAAETLPLPAAGGIPLVLTVHDLRFGDRRFASPLRGVWTRFFLRRNLRRASGLITVSATTATALTRRGLCPPDRTFGVPNAPAARTALTRARRQEILDHYRITDPYFICVGRMEKRKNIAALLDGWDEFVRQSGRGILLVLAGSFEGRSGREVVKRARASNGVLFTGVVTEEAKGALLEESIALVQPSLYEGFGLPLLEAMTARVPIACSSIPAHREVAGEAALYFDPDDRSGMARALDMLARENQLRDRLAAAGAARCAAYSWDRSAELLEDAYRSIVNRAQP